MRSGGGDSALATEQKPLTQKGSLVGTLQYMAPEQLEGKDTDARTDLFALGSVLHEMVTGKRAFYGTSQASLIASILSSEPPPVSAVQPLSPAPLDRVVQRCLAKDPDERWQTARDLAAGLRWVAGLRGVAGAGVDVARAPARREVWAWALAGAAVLTALIMVSTRSGPAEPRPAMRFAIDAPPGAALSYLAAPVVSPDGRHVAFGAQDESGEKLWVRSLDSLEARPLPRTEGAFGLSWSPDSRSFVHYDEDGRLVRAGVAGEPPRVLFEGTSTIDSATWNDDDVILVSFFWSTIHRVDAADATPRPLTRFDAKSQEISHENPQFLPDGEHFLFYVHSRDPEVRGTYAASLASPDERRLILHGARATYAAPGYLLYARNGSLIAQPFDEERFEITGEPAVVAEGVQMIDGGGVFSASSNGVLVYRAPSAPDFQLAWFDRSGNRLETLDLPSGARNPELSPDGERLAFERYDPETGWRDIWIYEFARAVSARFTFDPSNDSDPLWSPDGTNVIFSSMRQGYASLYRKSASGSSGEPELVHESVDEEWPMSWSPDGQHVVYNRWPNDVAAGRLWLLPLSEGGEAEPLIDSGFQELQGQFSPDRRWISYSSDESGAREVYVQRFRTDEKLRISTAGGSDARWRGDGREIFYLAPDRRLMVVPLREEGGVLVPSRPEALFQTRSGEPLGVGLRFNYAVSRDGQRFLVQTAREQSEPAPIVVVLNWPEALAGASADP